MVPLGKKNSEVQIPMSIEKLKKKTTVIDIQAESVEETAAIQGDELDKEMCTDIAQPPVDDINPFGSGDDEANAVEAIQATIDPDPERLPMIANASNPRANAIGDTVTDYITLIAGNKQATLKDLGTFGKSIIRNCLKHQIGQQGKDNRTRMYLEALKARMQFEQEKELSAGDKAFGPKR